MIVLAARTLLWWRLAALLLGVALAVRSALLPALFLFSPPLGALLLTGTVRPAGLFRSA